jgi:hypothetical protein
MFSFPIVKDSKLIPAEIKSAMTFNASFSRGIEYFKASGKGPRRRMSGRRTEYRNRHGTCYLFTR